MLPVLASVRHRPEHSRCSFAMVPTRPGILPQFRRSAYLSCLIVIPLGVSPTLCFKDLGLRIYAVLLNNNNKNACVRADYEYILLWILVFLEGVVDATCLRSIEMLLLSL